MQGVVYLNGAFVPAQNAQISAFDRGFLFGDAIYETLRAEGKNILFLEEHLARLAASAQAMQFSVDALNCDFRQIIAALIERNNLERAYIRITISRGEGDVGFAAEVGNKHTVLVQAKPFHGFGEEKYTRGVPIRLAKTRRNAPEAIDPQIKSVSNLNSLQGKLEAREYAVLDVLMLNTNGHVCEGSASNIFWVRGNTVYTPSEKTGILIGVTRSKIIDCVSRLGLKFAEGEFALADVLSADEVFLTSTSLEVMPVSKIDDETIGAGRAPKTAKALRSALQESYR